jgi:hypothetical protein
LKESSYFLAGAVLVGCVIYAIRPGSLMKALAAIALGVVALWVLSDLRRGAEILIPAGIVVGLLLRFFTATPRRALAAATIVIAVATGIAMRPALVDRITAGLGSGAKMHTGHVFTVGHAYKLLDEGFYVNPQTPSLSTITLTPAQAARFVVRSVVSFVTTPLPWQLRSTRELVTLPAVLLWYLLVLGIPAGALAGWRRDSMTTAILVGFVVPTAAVLAMTNGNVGTLVRLRDLVVPYLVWISVLGYCVAIEQLSGARAHAAH